jgi:hypothetical protein
MTDKNAKVNELYGKLKEGVKGFYSTDTFKDYLKFQANFHHYTWNNMMLIFLQNPDASRVAGFEDWKKVGRHPLLGSKGLKILAPSYKKVRNVKTGIDEQKLVGFHQTSVFDVSQTGGAELPTLTKELTMDTPTLKTFYGTLKAVCPVPMEEVTIKDGSKGYYMPSTDSIGIKKGMATLQKCKTLVHEMVHAILHKDSNKSSQLKEVEAEGTAFVVLSYFGFDTSEYSFNYVGGWNGSVEAETIQIAGNIIQKTAKQLIEMIESQKKKEENPAA